MEEVVPIQSQPTDQNKDGDHEQIEQIALQDSSETGVAERKRILTEKGQSLHLENLKKVRVATGAALRRQISKVSSLLDNTLVHAGTLEQERDILDTHRDRMNEANECFAKELQDPGELDEIYQWFDIRDREYLECRTKINKLIYDLEEKHSSDRMSMVTSTYSKRSSSSSIRSRRAKAAAKAACLQVEMGFLETEAEYKKIQMMKEIAKAKAEEEAMRKIEKEEDQEEQPLKHEVTMSDVKPKAAIPKWQFLDPRTVDSGILNPQVEAFVPSHPALTNQVTNPFSESPVHNTSSDSPSNKDSELSSVVKVLVEQQRMSLLPTQQPPVFSGNYFEYPTFISAFESLIESRIKKNTFKNSSSFSTTVSPPQGQDRKQSPWSPRSCPLCSKHHDLEDCSDFKAKSLEERKKFIMTRGLCFGCLHFGHISKKCQKRKECKTCSKSHPTTLHDESKSSTKETNVDEATSSCTSTCNATGTDKSITNTMIVPVYLHHQDNPERQLMVYALLDPASNGTFVREETMRELQVSGVRTQLLLNTMHGTEVVPTQKVEGLFASRVDKEVQIKLPKAYTREEIPSKRDEIPRPESAAAWPHLHRIASKVHPYEADLVVGLLIGSNCPSAIKPKEVIPGRSNDPYAIRTVLGWGIIGPITQGPHKDLPDISCNRVAIKEVGSKEPSHRSFVFKTNAKEIITTAAVRRMFEADFSETKDANCQSLSMEDRSFMAKVKEGVVHRPDGHYEMPLPFRDEHLKLPNNEKVAVHRLQQLKFRFSKDKKYKNDYTTFMSDMIKNSYAEKVPMEKEPTEAGRTWYIPHHGVYHPKKPEKIRVVFDCSAEFQGESLNKHLLSSPDLTNKLIGVLTRFRQEPVALMSDIEAMFHQVQVSEKCRDFLRFLWWEDGDTSKEPTRYRMRVHLFGAGSSPGCCNFALKKTADDHEGEIGTEPANFLRHDFYVDDGLKSVPTVQEAVTLIYQAKEMCHRGGFNLHKFISNKREVIEAIPVEDRAKGIKDLNLEEDALPIERALGVHWCVEADTFEFRIVLQDRPLTRRSILSTISSVYDPIGFLAPLLLPGKRILQELCRGDVGWDDEIPEPLRARWQRWRSELRLLEKLSIPRCFKPEEFGPVATAQLHHFSDASTSGYGQCSFLRLQNDRGEIHCSFVIGKARVAPLTVVTVPRLELTAAVVSTRVSNLLQQELQYKNIQQTFWTDSEVVLGYIRNDARRFQVFVANRVQQIRTQTSPQQWRHVDTKNNPADDASRGLTASELLDRSRWIRGPQFLWKPEEQWPQSKKSEECNLSSSDPEIKKATARVTEAQETWDLTERMEYFSDWHRARRALAICLRYRKLLHLLVMRKKDESATEAKCLKKEPVAVEEITSAEVEMAKAVQAKYFEKEISILREGQKKKNKTASSLHRLDPFLDRSGLLRVGGRIKRSNLPEDVKFPVILPRKGHLSSLIIRYFHGRVEHQGRGITLNEIRSNGYWVIGGTSAVARQISKCVTCNRSRGTTQEQKMSDLPKDRLESSPPFTYAAVDYCGPWYIKEGRKEVKRYIALFTCMASRAVHLEVSHSLETDSFLNAFRRFICRRGPVRQIRSDQGTNFMGAKKELREALLTMDQKKIRAEMLKENCDWVKFKTNATQEEFGNGRSRPFAACCRR